MVLKTFMLQLIEIIFLEKTSIDEYDAILKCHDLFEHLKFWLSKIEMIANFTHGGCSNIAARKELLVLLKYPVSLDSSWTVFTCFT